MSVRRLHPEQPAKFAFSRENLAWAKAQIRKYPPGKQASAVIPILWRAHEQEGWLTRPAMEHVAEMLDMSFIRVYEVATFYTMFQLSPVGKKAHVQVCGTTPCMLRGAEDLIKVCKRKIAEHPFEVSADGDFSWEEVECLGACVNAPMVQVFKDTYEDLTPESFERILDDIAAGRTPRPGPRTAARQVSRRRPDDAHRSVPVQWQGAGLRQEDGAPAKTAEAAPAQEPASKPTGPERLSSRKARRTI